MNGGGSTTSELRNDALNFELQPRPTTTFLGETESLLASSLGATMTLETTTTAPTVRRCSKSGVVVCLVVGLFVGGRYALGQTSPKRSGRARHPTPEKGAVGSLWDDVLSIVGVVVAVETTDVDGLTNDPEPSSAEPVSSVDEGAGPSCADEFEWEYTSGGYREACRGEHGNLGDFHELDLDAARLECCSLGEECAGFSYDNVTGTGVFKTNVRCGVTASAVYDGYAKADHIVYDERGIVAVVAPAAPDDGPATTAGCDAGVVWEHASGGYREACGGDFGNLESFQSLSLEEARDACCVSQPSCAGLSFNNATGSGVLKANTACGVTTSSVYDGYSIVKSRPFSTRSGASDPSAFRSPPRPAG